MDAGRVLHTRTTPRNAAQKGKTDLEQSAGHYFVRIRQDFYFID
jgi:hypothetical protein